MFLMKHPLDHPLQDLNTQVCHNYHPKNIHLIKMTLLLYNPKFFFYLNLIFWYPSLSKQDLIMYYLPFLSILPLDTPCYQPSILIQILQILHPILRRSPYFLQVHNCDLQNILKSLTQHSLLVLPHSVRHLTWSSPRCPLLYNSMVCI